MGSPRKNKSAGPRNTLSVRYRRKKGLRAKARGWGIVGVVLIGVAAIAAPCIWMAFQ